jgi:hypothetical protein
MFRRLHIYCTGDTARIDSSVSRAIRPRDSILDSDRDFSPSPTLDLARNLHVLPPRGIGVVSWGLPSLLLPRVGGVFAQGSSKRRGISSGVWVGEHWLSTIWTFVPIINTASSIILEKLIFFSQPRNFPRFMEHEDIILCSQHSTTGVYPEPDKSSPFF